MVGPPLAAGCADSRSFGASHTAQYFELVLRFWQCRAGDFYVASGHWNFAGADLRAIWRGGVEQLAGAQSRCNAGLVRARAAWMGLELHGRGGADSHGAGVSFRSLQIPA